MKDSFKWPPLRTVLFFISDNLTKLVLIISMLIKLLKPIKLVGDDERIIPVTLKDDLEGQFHYRVVFILKLPQFIVLNTLNSSETYLRASF